MQLKHSKYYWAGTEKVQFIADVEKQGFFTIPVAKFIWSSKTISVKSIPFKKDLFFSEELPFEIEYSNGNWSAPLREAI